MGLGGTLEGFGVSQWLYEYVLDRAWDLKQSDEQWLRTLANRHVGKEDASIQEAFRMLADDIYVKTTYSGICPIACIHPCLEGNWRWTTLPEVPYTFEQIGQVWAKLLESPADTDWYKFDIVNIGDKIGIPGREGCVLAVLLQTRPRRPEKAREQYEASLRYVGRVARLP